MNVMHTTDEQCTVDQETDCCRECGVYHGEICPECFGRGFHGTGCPLSDATERGQNDQTNM